MNHSSKLLLQVLRLLAIASLVVFAPLTKSATKQKAADPRDLIGVEIVNNKYPDGWERNIGLPTGLPEIKAGGEVIRRGNAYALVSKKYLTIYSKTLPTRFVIVGVKPTKYSYKKKHSMQQNCEHPTVRSTEKIKLFAFSKSMHADYCRVKTRDLVEAWTINFETGELKQIDHKGMSCNISLYLSGLGPSCKNIEGLKDGK